ncbi:MAG TPA: WecB/TagA/CpsF family glycosyltransferase [Streptosporangiaceae bacterium]|jgi:N-acetylglucosaminyldiphosphoundecaprenol N-acetyl-beta-D-mannosaminyltransferase|nr:WecB/TagA/CpsF family glycosyltransferase [Streptosporangiaceae bacterium]
MTPRARVASPGLPGVRLDALSLELALQRCGDVVDGSGYLRIGMVNAAKVVTMRKDEALRAAVCDSGLVLADGQAVVWASGLLGAPLPERVTGIDLFTGLLARAERRGYRVYFLGAKADVLGAMVAEVTRLHPGLVIAGYRDGYFTPDQDGQVAAAIKATGADLLFIGISSPRKEMFAQAWGEATGAKVVHGVGGSFDILAGLVRRAPAWWQRHGLEWLYRALQEPVRLGRRYLTTNLAFMALVARAAAARLAGGIPAGQPPAVDTGGDAS